MNIAMKLTMDGLVRALRWKAHEIAEDYANGERRRETPVRDARPDEEGGRDERSP